LPQRQAIVSRVAMPQRTYATAANLGTVDTPSSSSRLQENGVADSPRRGAPTLDLLQRLYLSGFGMNEGISLVGIGMLGAAVLLATAEPAAAASIRDASVSGVAPNEIASIAENSDFWANVLRYVSYFFSVLLGTAYVALKPVVELLKRPTTAVLVVAGAAVLYFFVSTTVSAMLGINDLVEYNPSSIVTPAS
jgi:hypothetical protein